VKVVILCGGQGTRLREETEFRPKPLVEIGGRPILWHIMKILGHQGLKEFVLCLGYKGNLIKEYFLNYEAMNNDIEVRLGSSHAMKFLGSHDEQDYSVSLVDTGPMSGTGTRVKRVSRFLDGPRFMVTYGDGLANVDVGALLAFHEKHRKLATITTTRVPGRFGVVDFGNEGQVTRFREKPTNDGWVSAGYMILEREALKYIGDDDECMLEREPLERIAREGELMAYRHEGDFHPMDTYRDHVHLNELWSSGRASWKIW
jgi:glucose-1-phosphate cytidylyltransferase